MDHTSPTSIAAEVEKPALPRRARFSLLSLLLFTALVCLGISHFQTSRKLQETQQALAVANSELGSLTVEDQGRYAALSLPTFGPMQWRWRLHLPQGRRYRLRWAADNNVPESGIPQVPRSNQIELLDQYAKPIATGEPFILTMAVHKNNAGKWVLQAVLPTRSTAINIDPAPEWLDEEHSNGWGSRVMGSEGTESVALTEPLVLLRYRKGKEVPPGAVTIDMQPTDGIMVWIEEIPAKQ
jgi:hypothetical protein